MNLDPVNQPPTAFRAGRVLIVDDEIAQMRALCETLSDKGFFTVGFASGAAALMALRSQPFELLLTDLSMPDMDGLSLLRQAREIDPTLVGVLMTGHGTIDTAVEAMKSGALDYVLKPFKLRLLLPVLERALDIRRLRLENEALQRHLLMRTQDLEAANKELEAYSHSISHDLRAPIRAVINYAGLILSDHGEQMPPEARELLQRVCSNSERMARLIEDLLAFARFTRHPLNRQLVDMASLTRAVLKQFQGEISARAVEVRIAELPPCMGDASLITQVILNLLSNAFKFTRDRTPAVVEIGTLPGADGPCYYVRDNGAGFSMEHAHRLFGVFQRLHHAGEFEGTGIGLSIVQRILRRHGGRIWTEAEAGRGATFYFTLPPGAA